MARSELILDSTFEELDRAVDFIESFVSEHALSEDLLDRLRLVGSEAVTNAIKHGNKLDADKKVTLRIALVNGFVEMRVTDEGPGFVIEEIPDPLAAENLLAEGGRGVYFIFQFADEVVFEHDGSVLLTKFELPQTED